MEITMSIKLPELWIIDMIIVPIRHNPAITKQTIWTVFSGWSKPQHHATKMATGQANSNAMSHPLAVSTNSYFFDFTLAMM